MAIITTSSAPKTLWPGVNAWYGQAYNEFETEYTALFNTETSRRAYEEVVGATGFGLAQVKPQGQSISYDDQSQAFITRYTPIRYALGFIITHEAMVDNLYDTIGKRGAQDLAFSMRQTQEVVGANVYNRAFNSSYTGGDGVEMISTAHPNFTGGTQSNESSTNAALSEVALEQACIDISRWTTDRGLLIKAIPQQLIVPRELQFEAQRIIGSQYRTTSSLTTAFPTFTSGATNDINALNSMGKFTGFTLNHYLESATAWFIRTNVPNSMTHFEREGMVFAQDNDYDTDNAKYKATARYAFGWSDWRGIYGSTGA